MGLADSAATVQTEYTYEAFGKTTATGVANTNPFQYTGRENDGTGLYYYRARYYHSALQRFIVEDKVFNILRPNRYEYAHSNPLKFIDHDGNFALNPICASCLAAAGITQIGAAVAGCLAGCKGSCSFGECVRDCIFSNPLTTANLDSLKGAALLCANACVFERLLFPGPEPPVQGPPPPAQQAPPQQELPLAA